MKPRIIIVLFTALFFCVACFRDKDCHYAITFINNSNNTLYIDWCGAYPDTLWIGDPNPLLNDYNKVLPFENNCSSLRSRDCFCYNFNYPELVRDDTIMVYVFDADVLENTPWDTVKAKYLVLERYDLSLEDLERLNWTITYPKDSIK
jgi:hypothetical protein